MKLVKVILVVLVLFVIGLLWFVLPSKNTQQTNQQTKQTNQQAQSRADDPTYAEEVKALSAIALSNAQKSDAEKTELQNQISQLQRQLKDLTRQAKLSPKNSVQYDKVQKELANLDDKISQALNPIKQQISALTDNQKTRARRGNQTASGSRTSSRAGYVQIRPHGQVPVRPTVSNEKAQVIPVYTIHSAAMLADSRSVTPLIGRVPNTNNTIRDPFRFRIITGGQNLMANRHKLPAIKEAIWSGYAVGVREESCIRGYLDTVTFVFADGRIATHTGRSKNQNSIGSNSNAINNSLGYLADPAGKQCINGLLISNASQYLTGRAGAAFLEGLASAYASAQTTIQRDNNGGLSSFVDGRTVQFGLGRGISKSAGELADYVRQRQANAFDVVYLPNNQSVNLMIEKEIPIDYDPKGRKVSYFGSQNNKENIHAKLD